MAIKRPRWQPGRLEVLEHTSSVLADNALGDPHVRELPVWVPPQYDSDSERHFPVLFYLAGFTGSGLAHVGWRNFDDSLPERAARLIATEAMAPVIIVFPDCFTALGGNQYVNSSAVGRYADYLTRELIPFVDGEFRTLAAREHRGCLGKSSGGYGAIIHGMKYAQHWGAIANHSGDAYFDFVYQPGWPETLDVLARHRRRKRREGTIDMRRETRGTGDGVDDGRIRRFLKHFWDRPNPTGAEINCLMHVAMAATYDPDPDAPLGFRVPFDLETGEMLPKRWRRWLRHDPVRLVERYRDNLVSLRGIFIDCGWRDQYRIHYGTRLLSLRLHDHGIAHRYEEFDGTHSSIDYRMDRSLPYLVNALR